MNYYVNILVCSFLLILMAPAEGQPEIASLPEKRMRVASCQFPVSSSIPDNAGWICQQMRVASDSGAHVAHFPELALTGYPGVDMPNLENLDWQELRAWTDTISDLAAQLHIWVVLGSAHNLDQDTRPMNSLYLIGPDGRIRDRYDKRFCTRGDLKHFSAGDHPVIFEINGIRSGLLICFDVRFPELYRDYRRLGVDMIFQSFYNARQKPGGIHPKIMPVTAQARAATNHIYMSLTNSSTPSSWPCHFITPDGLISDKLPPDQPGILFSEADLSEDYYDASRHFRERVLDGKNCSEDPPDHPRYLDRKSL